MKKSTILAVLIIVFAISGVGAFFLTKDSDSRTGQTSQQSNVDTNSQEDTTQNTPEQPQTSDSDVFTKEEVAKHNNAGDCWTIIDEKVYNLTSYISVHDGGDEILKACGIDGTSLFTERQTSDGEDVGTGTPHSETAENELEKLQVGIISD